MNSTEIATMPKKHDRQHAKSTRRHEPARVLGELEQFCSSLEVGDRIPTHTELMRRFSASERTVLGALDELVRRGRIIRRHGAGTFVADVPSVAGIRIVSGMKSIVAIARPDQSFFDRCIELLYAHTDSSEFELVCRLLSPDRDLSNVFAGGFGDANGYIVFSNVLAPLAKQLIDSGRRAVVVGTPSMVDPPAVPYVHGDHEQGGYLAAKHVIDMGHLHIAYANVHIDPAPHPRWVGHLRAVAEANRRGKPVVSVVLHQEELNAWSDDPTRAAAYFAAEDAPTGLTMWNDYEALKLLPVLARAGVSVPGDVSVIGYDGLPQGELVSPRLTTMDSGIQTQLDAAVRLLMQDTPPPATYTAVALPTLVQRDSVAVPKQR